LTKPVEAPFLITDSDAVALAAGDRVPNQVAESVDAVLGRLYREGLKATDVVWSITVKKK
jgi:hypothetical protein